MIPPSTDKLWKEIVLGRTQHRFQMFGANFLIGRVVLSTRTDPSPENVERRIKEVHEFFLQNEKFARKDLTAIFGGESNEKTHVGG